MMRSADCSTGRTNGEGRLERDSAPPPFVLVLVLDPTTCEDSTHALIEHEDEDEDEDEKEGRKTKDDASE